MKKLDEINQAVAFFKTSDEMPLFCPDIISSSSTNTEGAWRLCCEARSDNMNIKDVSPLEYLHSDVRNDYRMAMVAGDRSRLPVCETCFKMEDANLESRRQRIIRTVGKQHRSLSGIVEALNSMSPDGSIPLGYIDRMDIRFLGNSCNCACYTCFPRSSSALGNELKKLGELPADYTPIINPFAEFTAEMDAKFWDDFGKMLPHLRLINFTGGEPFMLPSYWKILDFIVASGYANTIILCMTTNMTTVKHKKKTIMDYFEHFEHVGITASIDGTPEYNAYVRYPTDSAVVWDNIRQIKDRGAPIIWSMNTTASALTAKNIPAIREHITAEGMKTSGWQTLLLKFPKYQTIRRLPYAIRQDYLDRYYGGIAEDDYQLKYVIQELMLPEHPETEESMTKIRNRLVGLDRLRGTDYRKLWPEFE